MDSLRAEIADLRSRLATLSARLDDLEDRRGEPETALVANDSTSAAGRIASGVEADTVAEIRMAAAPEIEAEKGFSFKPFGRLMLDAGFTDFPEGFVGDDGWTAEARRARLGVEGEIPGGFAYKMEVDFAGNTVDITDALIEYGSGDVTVTAGQFNNFQSMEELTSSRFTSMIERAAFTDAFGFTRRLGIAVEFGADDVLVQGGVFHDNLADLPESERWSLDGRAAYFPELASTQLHLGGSIHYAGTSGDMVRYRQRPLVHFTSARPINTDNFEAQGEFGLGIELAAINGPFHFHAEGYRQQVGGLSTADDATFFGGFIESGVFLTPGDSRGYGGGRFNRTRPVRPVGEGGIGALQFNVRYDYLELNDADAGILGGTQNGFYGSLIWTTTDYTRFMVNYGKLYYDNAALAIAGEPDYDVDVLGMRAEFDF